MWAYLTGQASARSLCRLTEDGGCTERGGEQTDALYELMRRKKLFAVLKKNARRLNAFTQKGLMMCGHKVNISPNKKENQPF